MKKNRLKEMRTKDLNELEKEAGLLKEQLAKMRLESLTGKVKNLKSVKNLKRDLAQILTLIKEKQ